MASDEYRRLSYGIWQDMAAGWERDRKWIWDMSRPVAEDMIDALRPEPGQTILELAAGAGDTGFAAARVIGPEGRLISTDFAPEMVAAARRESQRLGLDNVEHREMDAERMELEDDSVDGVLCRWGYMLMADPAAALLETRRVLRPGGRLALSVWGDPERNPWATIPARVLREQTDATLPGPDEPGIFALADPVRLRALLADTGFDEPTLSEVEVLYRFADFDGYWRFVEQIVGVISGILRTLTEEDREATRAAVADAMSEFRVDGELEVPGMALNAATA